MKCRRSFLNLFATSWVLAVCLVTGCKSVSPSQYVSPRVEGRVLDGETGQPLQEVEVRRVSANESYRVTEPAKGAEGLKSTPGVRTAADGTFALRSVRALVLFRHAAWYSVSLTFRHPGYQEFMTSYTLTDATNTAGGEPLVKTGDVLLMPRGK